MGPTRSLRLRLFLFAIVAIAAAMALTGFGLTAIFTRHIERRIGQELDTHLQQLIGGVRFDTQGAMSLEREPADPRFVRILGGLYWQVEDTFAKQVLASRSLWNETLALPPDRVAQGDIQIDHIVGPGGAPLLAHERTIVIAVGGVDRRIRFSAAIDRAEMEPLRAGFTRDLMMALGVLGLLLIAGFGIQIRSGLRPLDTVRGALGKVRAGEASRLAADVPAEVAPLVAEVNALLDAQEQQIVRSRDRAADLAHGLRTPLTALAGDIDRLRRKGETEIANDIAQLAQRMRRHTERELVRARIRHNRSGTASNLAIAASDIVRTLERTPEGMRVRFECAIDPKMSVAVDGQDLSEMLGNLIENAAKYARTQVRISGTDDAGADRIVVEDDGPGLDDAASAKVAMRGVRLDVNGPGAGLGLAIVQDIADAYGAELTLGASELGGLAVEVVLPAKRKPAA